MVLNVGNKASRPTSRQVCEALRCAYLMTNQKKTPAVFAEQFFASVFPDHNALARQRYQVHTQNMLYTQHTRINRTFSYDPGNSSQKRVHLQQNGAVQIRPALAH